MQYAFVVGVVVGSRGLPADVKEMQQLARVTQKQVHADVLVDGILESSLWIKRRSESGGTHDMTFDLCALESFVAAQ